MNRVIIWPYNIRSSAARNLAEELSDRRAKRVRSDGNYQHYRNHVVINYGNTGNPGFRLLNDNLLNRPEYVAVAVDKLDCLNALANDPTISVPEFTTEYGVALGWSEKSAVVNRSLLRASAARGMKITEKEEKPVEVIDGQRVQLWTKYVPKKREFRLHVFDSKVIDAQEKRKVNGREDVNSRIRNLDNGWIFARENLVLPEGAELMAISAVQKLKLDFGAVDMIYNQKKNKCYILEVNTAPGLEGTTVKKYADAIRNSNMLGN